MNKCSDDHNIIYNTTNDNDNADFQKNPSPSLSNDDSNFSIFRNEKNIISNVAPAPTPSEPEKEKPKKSEKQTTFNESAAADENYFFSKFQSEEYSDIDLAHYYAAVADWSEMNRKIKRTARGWIATVRTFIRRDKLSNTVRKKPQDFNFDNVKKFLNNNFE